MRDDMSLFTPELAQRLNRYCRALQECGLADAAFRKVAGAIASQLHDKKKERDRMMRNREWMRLALSEEFRNYAPIEAVRSVAEGDRDGLLQFLPEEDTLSRSVLRLMGLSLLVNKIASGEVLVTTAGGVAAGKSTLICSLSGIDTSHLRDDERGQSVVTLLVSAGNAANLVAMPLSGAMQGRGEDSDENWGATAVEATEHLARILSLNPRQAIELAKAMDYFATHQYDAERLASIKVTRPHDEGLWHSLRTKGASMTLLDARGFETIADAQTVETGHLFAQGAEVPVILVSLRGEWIKDRDTVARRDLISSDYADYFSSIASVLGKESAKRMVVVFTFLNHLVDPKEGAAAVTPEEMTRRVGKFMGDSINRIIDLLQQNHIDPKPVRWLLLDPISHKSAEPRRAFWSKLPPEVVETYGTQEQFDDWFCRDGGLAGLCAVLRETTDEVIIPRRREDAMELLRGFAGGRITAIFNETFPHLVPECREIFRENAFCDFRRQEFNDRLDTQQVEGAARNLQDRANRLGIVKAHELFWGCSFAENADLGDLGVTEQMLVQKFYPGVSAGVSALLQARADSGDIPPDTRRRDIAVAAFLDLMDSIANRDGEGTKDFLKHSLREVTGKAREYFADFSPLASELGEVVNDIR